MILWLFLLRIVVLEEFMKIVGIIDLFNFFLQLLLKLKNNTLALHMVKAHNKKN